MNISALTIYLWQLADKIASASSGIAVVLSVAAIIYGIITLINIHSVGYWKGLMERTEDRNYTEELKGAESLLGHARPLFKLTFFTSVFLWIVVTLIPSSNTVAMMVVIPKIAESKAIQQDLPDLYNAAVEALKASLKK